MKKTAVNWGKKKDKAQEALSFFDISTVQTAADMLV